MRLIEVVGCRYLFSLGGFSAERRWTRLYCITIQGLWKYCKIKSKDLTRLCKMVAVSHELFTYSIVIVVVASREYCVPTCFLCALLFTSWGIAGQALIYTDTPKQ
jgi:hypothetical protein